MVKMRQRASEIWVRRNLFLTIVFVCFGSRYVEVRCVFVTSNIGFQHIPRILGQVELSQDGYSISEPSERGDLVQNPRVTEETKNVLDTWHLGPRLFQGFGPRIQSENGRPQGWGLRRLFFGV